MALKLVVEGCREKVKGFVDSLKLIPQWRFYSRSKLSIGGDELRVETFFDEKPYMKPTLSKRQISKLLITSKNGETMEIVLLDAEVIEMGNGLTYVHGKNYDPYSAPARDR